MSGRVTSSARCRPACAHPDLGDRDCESGTSRLPSPCEPSSSNSDDEVEPCAVMGTGVNECDVEPRERHREEVRLFQHGAVRRRARWRGDDCETSENGTDAQLWFFVNLNEILVRIRGEREARVGHARLALLQLLPHLPNAAPDGVHP